ncbi:MFS transporter [Lacticaseibacillus baoqingensis]|uniref:MFS transporter n=1 Tax=Lacticaseibacillus baoqingensis TaxID=2486013 RepID=A0ABW4E555_9LACO|nr:MFS transporter [Lacticaseibacillus baoqingensis]
MMIAILSLSFFTMLTGAVLAPVLPAIHVTYPAVAEVWLQLLMTMPAVIFIGSLPVLRYLPGGKKTQVIWGLAIYLVGGSVPLIPLPFGGLLACRALSGVGLALFAGPAVSLIADHYQGPQQRHLLGVASAVASAGSIVSLAGAGMLAQSGWRMVFSLYALAIVPLGLVSLFVPNSQAAKPVRTQGHFSRRIWATFGLIMIWNMGYFVVPTAIPFAMQQLLHDANASHAGWALASVSGIGLLIGVSYAHWPLTPPAKEGVCFVVLVVLGVSMTFASWGTLVIAIAAAGVGIGLAMPVFNEALAAAATLAQRDQVLTIGSAALYAGQVLAPFVYGALPLSARFSLVAVIGLGVLGFGRRRFRRLQG